MTAAAESRHRDPVPVRTVGRALALGRGAACVLGIGLQSLVIEVWLRLVLLRHRSGDERARIAAVNHVLWAWGASSFWIARVLLGLRVRIQGEPPSAGRFLVVSNHQSSLDPSLLVAALPALNLKFAAKEELRRGKPAVSLGLRAGGSVFVGKEDTGKDISTLVRFGRQMERFEGSPVLFPEGWRTEDGTPRPFLTGGTEAVRRSSRLPILVTTIDGLWPARTMFQWHRIVGADVTLRIGEPISPDEVDRDPRKVYREIEARVRRDLEEIRASRRMAAPDPDRP